METRTAQTSVKLRLLVAAALAFSDAGANPVHADTVVRAATYNLSLNRNSQGQLVNDLNGTSTDGGYANRLRQINTVAEIVQRTNPDVLLINEFDYASSDLSSPQNPVNLFRSNFLQIGKDTLMTGSLAAPAVFPHAFVAPSNTGIHSGFDLNNNGQTVSTPGANGYGDDAFGFGDFPGQFGMAFVSRHPIERDQIRTFQTFLWKDMPGALLPDNVGSPTPNDFYSPQELGVFRLSSKSHWDIPVNIDGTVVHFLVSHPTPPVFDGAEDRNGRRNFDEIRLWKDYVNGASYIYDDAGVRGGLPPNTPFVIMGDQNSDPNDGDSLPGSINQLLNDPLVDASVIPDSAGGPQQSALQGGVNSGHLSNPLFDTADFADTGAGNVRVDYVLPSQTGLTPIDGGVFWPLNTDPYHRLVGTFNNPNYFSGFPSSDHKLTYVDLTVVPEPSSGALLMLGITAAGGVRPRRK